MTGYGVSQIKCEPTSEEEDSNSQFAHSFFISQRGISELRPVKIEPNSSFDGDVSNHLLQDLHGVPSLAELTPAGPAATPVCVKEETPAAAGTFETLHTSPHARDTQGSALLERHLALTAAEADSDFMPLLVKDEPLSEGEQQTTSGDDAERSSPREGVRSSPKSWTQRDMDHALDALRTRNMSLTRASATYGIPSTTLWQRAHRLGIDTPKKEGGAKSWSEGDLRRALHALRAGAISANKASKAYGIPSSTLYKIARREGIRLAAPFNAAPTSWRRADLTRALHAIRAGAASVQRAAAQYGIPTGTLYGRCKREGIELSRSNPTPWSEDAMGEALEAVRVGQMSINQAAIHYNLPYSSLYGRFKRCKYQPQPISPEVQKPSGVHQDMYYQQLNPQTVHHIPEAHNVQMPEEPQQYLYHTEDSINHNQSINESIPQYEHYFQSCNVAS